MRLLLDTHAFLWWLAGSRRLSDNARSAIEDDANDVLVSAATAWEIATKHRLGKLPQAGLVAQDLPGELGVAVYGLELGEHSSGAGPAARTGAKDLRCNAVGPKRSRAAKCIGVA